MPHTESTSTSAKLTTAGMQEAANAIIKRAAADNLTLTTRIYSRELFESSFGNILSDSEDMSLSSNDFNILLAFLARDKPILASDGTTIKFKAPGEEAPSPITEQDRNIASLRTLLTTMTAQTAILHQRIASLNLAVRDAITQKRTTQAKSSLRSKKLAEKTLEQREATLAQLEDVYTQIEQAADQVAVVRVMEASGSVLRGLHKEVGGVEGVEAVVDRLREEMENVDEVGRIINEGSAGGVDEDEVDEELAEMERVEREKREREEAEATKRRLDELERLDVERKNAEEEKAAKEEAGKEKEKTEDRVLEDAGETTA